MKRSSFDLSEQNQKIDSKIVVALERLSEAFRVLLWNESKIHALSPIQIQILIFLQFHSKENCRVSYLANEFNMTKATISDSIRVLLEKKLVAKETDFSDTRSYTISLTEEGEKITQKVSHFATPIKQPIENLSVEQKAIMLNILLTLIYDLNKAGIITIQRMCFTCSYYKSDQGAHYCNLLNTKLVETEIRVDCPEHQMMP